MLGLTRTVDDASHYGHFQAFHAGISLSPNRHLRAQITLNVVSHFLEQRTGRAAASGTRRNAGRESADTQALQNVLTGSHFFGAIAARRGRQADSDRVADTFLQ